MLALRTTSELFSSSERPCISGLTPIIPQIFLRVNLVPRFSFRSLPLPARDYRLYYRRKSCVFLLSTLPVFRQVLSLFFPSVPRPFSSGLSLSVPFYLHKIRHKNLLRRVIHTFHKVFHILFFVVSVCLTLFSVSPKVKIWFSDLPRAGVGLHNF